MKIKASLVVEMDISNDLIITYADYMADGHKPEISERSSMDRIKEYFEKNKKDIVDFARETAIDIMAEKCDDISLHANYKRIKIEEIENE